MHTSRYETPDHGEVFVIHNGDWSGDATVVWDDRGEERRVEVPGSLLTSIGRKTAVDLVRSEVARALEGLDGSD